MTQYKVEWSEPVWSGMLHREKVFDSEFVAATCVEREKVFKARITATREVGPWVEWVEPGGKKS